MNNNAEFEASLKKSGTSPRIIITEYTKHATDVFMCLDNIGMLMVHDATEIQYNANSKDGKSSFYDMMFCKIAGSTIVYSK
jgi:hypothetical protein